MLVMAMVWWFVAIVSYFTSWSQNKRKKNLSRSQYLSLGDWKRPWRKRDRILCKDALTPPPFGKLWNVCDLWPWLDFSKKRSQTPRKKRTFLAVAYPKRSQRKKKSEPYLPPLWWHFRRPPPVRFFALGGGSHKILLLVCVMANIDNSTVQCTWEWFEQCLNCIPSQL